MISLTILLVVIIILVCFTGDAYAFGAGDIPDFAWLNDKAFRHGDIENTLIELVKAGAGDHGHGGGLLGFAKSVLTAASGGKKFSKDDVKRVYFGNWLRDYSQCMDIAGLSKLSADTLILVVSVLGFLEFGFATEEFQVTADRLGVYLPVEHIDNPKGYAAKEGDARQFHDKLRPPVENKELEIDQKTGMKKYMATENEGFDTSTAYIRRSLKASIEAGRRARGNDGNDEYEAFRLLGQALHTLEDLLAHSNWCEIGLRKLGHNDVFAHVGDNVAVDTPNGRAPPLITGTFGSADFFHSLLGEATDKLSQSSVTDLSGKLNDSNAEASQQKMDALRQILGAVMNRGGSGQEDKLKEGEAMQQKAQAYDFNPDDVAPPEVQKQLMDALKWRDQVYRDILKQLQMIPGLGELIENLTEALNAYVYTLLAPYLTPILKQVTTVVGEGSKAVIESDDQYEVFNNPDASDPSHSMMAKDHFALILNEPAGLIAKVVLQHTVNQIVPAWGDDSNPDDAINRVLEAFHHPYYASGNSEVQKAMIARLDNWLSTLEDREETLSRLTKDAVKEHRNKRFSEEQQQQVSDPHTHGYATNQGGGGGGYAQTSHGQQQQSSGGYSGSQQQSYGGQQSYGSSGGQASYGGNESSGRQTESHGSRAEQSSGRTGYNPSYGGSQEQSSYGGGQEQSSYGGSTNTYGGGGSGYGGGQQQSSYGGGDSGYNSGRQEQSSYGGGDSGRQQQSSYGGGDSGYGGDSGSKRHGGDSGGDSGGYGGDSGGRGDSGAYGGGGSGYGGDSGSKRHGGDSGGDSGGYGGGDSGSKRYGGDSGGDSGGYGGDSGRKSYGGDSGGDSGSYGGDSGSRRHGGDSGGDSGYGGGDSGSRRKDNDETYGAERLNINENSQDSWKKSDW